MNGRPASSVYVLVTYAPGAGARPKDVPPHLVSAWRRGMLAVPILVAAAALLVGGCGASTGSDVSAATGHGGTEHGGSHPTTTTNDSKPAQAFTVQQLAAALGCQANLVGKAADFRQATCTAAEAEFVLLDFDTAEGQRAWLDHAEAYGGVYLVGDRWALSGQSKESLETLRSTLGGNIEEGDTHGS